MNLSLNGQLGCIDNSYHLKKRFDTKQYHYVACSCPCEQYAHVSNRNKCLKCGHYHAKLPPIYVNPKHLPDKKEKKK